jgi:hypothetical protein
MHELVSWKCCYHHLNLDPEMIYGNKAQLSLNHEDVWGLEVYIVPPF